MSKINLEIGGKYSAGQAFQKAQDATKQLGRETKDAASIGQSAFKGLADVVGGKTAGAFNILAGSVSAFATGGIFGLVASLGKLAFDAVSESIKKAEENVVRLYDYISSMTPKMADSLSTGTTKVSKDVAEAEANVAKLIAASNGKISGTVQNNVARLNVEGLQKVTDGMTEASKKALEAQTAYNAKMEQMNGEVDKASAVLSIWRQASEQLTARNDEINQRMEQLKVEEAALAQRHNAHLNNLLNYENQSDEQKQAIDENGKAIEAERNRLLKLRTELENASNKNKEQIIQFEQKEFEAQMALQTAEANRTAAELEMSRKLTDARLAVEAEEQASRDLAAQKAIEAEQSKEKEEFDKYILSEFKATEEEYVLLMEEKNAAIEEGLEDWEVEARLQETWLELMEERNAAIEKENDEAKKKGTTPSDAASMTVSLNNAATSDIGEQVEEHQNFKEWQKKQREELRKGRNAKNEMKQDLPAMTKALKGEMPEEQAKRWVQYAKQKYTPGQMTELANMARKTELMSTKSKEWHEQQERFKNMLKAMNGEDESSKRRDKNIQATTNFVKELKEEFKKAAMR